MKNRKKWSLKKKLLVGVAIYYGIGLLFFSFVYFSLGGDFDLHFLGVAAWKALIWPKYSAALLSLFMGNPFVVGVLQ